MIARREQIRELLKAARARIDPADVGLRGSDKPRSPGLRREDVAVLAGVSVKWYTWLEQGRDVNFSLDVVERVAAALALPPAERRYLTALIQRRSPTGGEQDGSITDSLWRTVQLAPVPAMVMTRRWDIVGWNRLVARVFRDYNTVPRAARNLLRIILTDRDYQSDLSGYAVIVRRLLREFRVDFAECADAQFEHLIAELKLLAPEFERLWRDVEVSETTGGISIVQHDELGELAFDRISYVPEGSAFLRVLLFTPRDPRTVAALGSIVIDAPDFGAPDVGCIRRVPDAGILKHPNRH